MKVYVQGENGLIPLQEDVTANGINKALGYTPADADDIIECIEESDDTTLYVTDKYGNIITKTDGEGFHAKAMTVNGKDVESGLVTDEDRESWGGSDLDDVISKDDDSTLYIVGKDNNVLAKIDSEGIKAIEVKVGEDQKSVTEHIEDGGIHATASEKAHWNDKSFDSLTDSPISSADDEVLYVVDKDQNIIAKIDKDGIHVTEVYIGNETDGELTAENLMKKILADWVGAAPAALDTIIELANAIQANQSVLDALNKAITDKANASDLNAHIGDNSHITATEREAWNKKLDGSTFEAHKTEYESHKTDYASHKSAFETHKTEFESHKGDNTHLGDEIKLDDDTALYIVDSVGNKIAQFDGSGLDVAALKLAGIDISDKIDTDIVTALNEAIENGDLGGSGLTAEQIALLKTLSDWYDDEHYENISITSFTNTLSGSHEKGDTVTGSATLAWAFNRTPKALTLNGTSKSVSSTGETIASATYSSDKTWTLKATGENGETSTKTTGIYFYNAIFYGVSSSITYDTTLLASLTKSLQNSHKSSLSVTAGEGEYIYYCVPASFSTPTFTIGGFVGGLTKVATVSYTNGTNTEDYCIYRSDYANLGDTTISIS